MRLMKKILAENFRFLDDALRAIEKLNDEVSTLLSLQKQYQRQTAALFLEVKLPSIKLSPELDPTGGHPKIANLDKMRKNYAVVHELWETQNAIAALETKIRVSLANKDVDVDKAIGELAKVRKRILDGLQEAFAFLSNLANRHLPEKFQRFDEAMSNILEKSIAYQDSKTFTYIYEVNRDIVFSTYFQLMKVTDDDGTYFPELYIVTSYRTGNSAEAGNYVGVLPAFVPPSEHVLMKKVDTIKGSIRALNMLLALDNFSTTMGSLPISMLLKDASIGIDRELFLYQQYIKSIRVDEEQVVFVLKPEITDKDIADKIIKSIYQDFKELIRKNRAQPHMSIKKAEKCFVLTFFFPVTGDTPPAVEDDVRFLKDRFNLNDTTVKNILRTINSNS